MGDEIISSELYTIDYPENMRNAGLYTINVTGTGIYEGYTGSCLYTITPLSLEVSGSCADGKEYDGTTEATVYPGVLKGAVEGDDVYIASAKGEFSDKNAGNGKNVTIVYTLGGADAVNYTIASDETCADIERKCLMIIADDITSYEGAPLKNLTYKTQGLVSGDEITGEIVTNADKDLVGTYSILQGSLDAGNNYIMDFCPGTYVVAEKTVSNLYFDEQIIDKTYGDDAFTYAVQGIGEDIVYESSDEGVATVDNNGLVSIVGAGQTTITATSAEKENITASSASYVLNVQKKHIIILSDSASREHNALPLTACGYKFIGTFADGDQDPTVTVMGSQTGVGTSDNTFTYEMAPGVNADNYDIECEYGVLEVTKPQGKINITVTDKRKSVADGLALTSNEFTFTVEGFNDGNPFENGAILSIVTGGSIKNVGIATNPVQSWSVADENGNDISSYFTDCEVTSTPGMLTISIDHSQINNAEPKNSEPKVLCEVFQNGETEQAKPIIYKDPFVEAAKNSGNTLVEMKVSNVISNEDLSLMQNFEELNGKTGFVEAVDIKLVAHNGEQEIDLGSTNETPIKLCFELDKQKVTECNDVSIYTVHNGQISKLEVSFETEDENGETESFQNFSNLLDIKTEKLDNSSINVKVFCKNNKFSSFFVVYTVAEEETTEENEQAEETPVQKEEDTNPSTMDGFATVAYVAMGVVAATVMAMTVVRRKREE